MGCKEAEPLCSARQLDITVAASFLFKNAISLTVTEKVIILQFQRAIKGGKKPIEMPADEILYFQDLLESSPRAEQKNMHLFFFKKEI